METKRQLDVLDKNLKNRTYLSGENYSIADIAVWPWYGALMMGSLYGAGEFLDVTSYKNLMRWTELINNRPAVKRGKIVNKTWGEEDEQLTERHDSSDFDKLKI